MSVLFVAVLAAYQYKMSSEQKEWWAKLIENAQAANSEQCVECAGFRNQIATHNFEIAAATGLVVRRRSMLKKC
jgi:hypothetical protein